MQKRLGLDLAVPDEFGHWIAGFTDGEGYFHASLRIEKRGWHQFNMAFKISLREDDRPTLEQIKSILGVGLIKRYELKTASKPIAIYSVDRTADLYHIIVPLFEKYPLQSKKAKDFQIWKKLVEIKYLEGRGCGPSPHAQSYWDKVRPIIEQLKDGRKFKPLPQSPLALS